MTAHVVGLRKRWYARRFTPQLTHVFQNDFGMAAVFLDKAVDLDVLALELANVANVAEVVVKNDNAEPTGFFGLAEVKREVSGRQWTYAQDLPGTQPSDPIFSSACRMERHFAEQSEERTREIAIRRSIGQRFYSQCPAFSAIWITV